jgi:hypothetical protein
MSRAYPAIVCGLAACVLAGCAPATFSKELAKLGYQRFQPPRIRIEPGTLIVIEEAGDGAISVQPVCWRDQAFPGIEEAVADPTFAQELKKNLEKTFELEAEYLDKIKANANYSRVDEITLTIQNASIPGYSDADLMGSIGDRSPRCTEAVRRREQTKGEDVYTVLSVLRADVVYTIGSTSEVGGKVKLPEELLEGLKVELGGSRKNAEDQTITGTQLHWGLKSDVFKVAPSPDSFGAWARVMDVALSEDQQEVVVRGNATLSSDRSDADGISSDVAEP